MQYVIQLVADKRDELNCLCQKYHVRRLDMFGSAASGENFDPQSSDLDFLADVTNTRWCQMTGLDCP